MMPECGGGYENTAAGRPLDPLAGTELKALIGNGRLGKGEKAIERTR